MGHTLAWHAIMALSLRHIIIPGSVIHPADMLRTHALYG